MDKMDKFLLITVATRRWLVVGEISFEGVPLDKTYGRKIPRLLDILNNPRSQKPFEVGGDFILLRKASIQTRGGKSQKKKELKKIYINREEVLYAYETDARIIKNPLCYEARYCKPKSRVCIYTDFGQKITGLVVGGTNQLRLPQKKLFIAITEVVVEDFEPKHTAFGLPFLALNYKTIVAFTPAEISQEENAFLASASASSAR